VRTPPWTIALAHALAVERTQSDELLRESQQRQARATAYPDNIHRTGAGTYTHTVCATAYSSCSDPVTINFPAGAAVSRAKRPAYDSRPHHGRWRHGAMRITHRGKKRS
jgi:hypothetical protein